MCTRAFSSFFAAAPHADASWQLFEKRILATAPSAVLAVTISERGAYVAGGRWPVAGG